MLPLPYFPSHWLRCFLPSECSWMTNTEKSYSNYNKGRRQPMYRHQTVSLLLLNPLMYFFFKSWCAFKCSTESTIGGYYNLVEAVHLPDTSWAIRFWHSYLVYWDTAVQVTLSVCVIAIFEWNRYVPARPEIWIFEGICLWNCLKPGLSRIHVCKSQCCKMDSWWLSRKMA